MTPETLPAAEPVAYRTTPSRRLIPLASGEIPPVGAHLVTPFFGFAHHGIYAGSGRVIHYGALMYDIIRKPVEEVAFEDFSEGRPVFVVQHADECLDAALVLRRARSRLGEKRYRLFSNNCEHFVEWCLHDVGRSFQAETALAYPRMMGERIESAILGFLRRLLVLVRPRAAVQVRVEDHSERRK